MSLPDITDKNLNYYKSLNCHQASSVEQITAEYRVLAKKWHPDTIGGDIETFQRIEEAKRILLNPSTKKSYDNWLNSGISVSYEVWKEKCGSNVHWAKPTSAFNMIMNDEEVSGKNNDVIPSTSSHDHVHGPLSWKSHADNSTSLFRQGKL